MLYLFFPRLNLLFSENERHGQLFPGSFILLKIAIAIRYAEAEPRTPPPT
jgi:hypothetical protein